MKYIKPGLGGLKTYLESSMFLNPRELMSFNFQECFFLFFINYIYKHESSTYCQESIEYSFNRGGVRTLNQEIRIVGC